MATSEAYCSVVPRDPTVATLGLCDFALSMGSCFYPMAHRNEITGCWKIVQFQTPPFSTDFDTDHAINVLSHTEMAGKKVPRPEDSVIFLFRKSL